MAQEEHKTIASLSFKVLEEEEADKVNRERYDLINHGLLYYWTWNLYENFGSRKLTEISKNHTKSIKTS